MPHVEKAFSRAVEAGGRISQNRSRGGARGDDGVAVADVALAHRGVGGVLQRVFGIEEVLVAFGYDMRGVQ